MCKSNMFITAACVLFLIKVKETARCVLKHPNRKKRKIFEIARWPWYKFLFHTYYCVTYYFA